MYADFCTYLFETNLLSNSEIRIIAIVIKKLNFDYWAMIDKKSIAQNQSSSESKINNIIQYLLQYKVIERKKDFNENYLYRLNHDFGWKKTVNWKFNGGIDWQIFLISFERLRDKYQLSIQTMQEEPDNLTVYLEVCALASPVEIKEALDREYYRALELKYKLQQDPDQLAIHQQNSINLLKLIKLINNQNNNFHQIEFYLGNKANKVTRHKSFKSSKNQTLAEAVAEQEQILRRSILALNELTYTGNYTTVEKNDNFKKRIRARLNKHCR